MIGQINVPLQRVNDFDALIFNKGYSVVISRAIECPCKGKSGAPLTTCHNCLGLGWFFVDSVETKAIITSINKDTKFKYWSPELAGTISVTVRNEEKFSFMDKIVFKSRTTSLSEVRPVLQTGSKKFAFLSYRAESINSVYLFNTETTKLIKLNPIQYGVREENPSIVELVSINYPATFNGAISVDYNHELSYNVVDIPHDFRSSFITDENGKNQEYSLPVQAIARRSHLVVGNATNYLGNNLLDNSV